jgi:hypothetical protein
MRHNIDEYEEFHQKVIQMMACCLLQMEMEEKDDVVCMISFQEKKSKICRLQHTESGPPKLILTRPAITYNENYNALLHNYRNSPNVESPASVF